MKLLRQTATAVLLTAAQAMAVLPAHAEGGLTPEQLTERGLQAGAAYPGLADICTVGRPKTFTGQRGGGGERRQMTPQERAARREAQRVEPMQVFDNLYFAGNRGVAAWVLKTEDGLILIDALNNNAEAEEFIEAGMKKLGLDPNEIRYLIITHAHGDHYGGQEFIKTRYGPRIVMSGLDWDELEKPEQEFSSPRWGVPPSRDMAVADGDVLTLGSTQLRIVVTPGHTPGTLSLIFPVFDNGQQHMAALWGGTGLRFGDDAPRLQTYSDSAARMRQLAGEAGADVFLSNHPGRDSAIESMDRLRQRKPGEPHPFVTGEQALGAFDLLSDCSGARAAEIRARG